MDRIGIFIGILLVFWMSSSSSSHKLRPAVGVDRILQDHVHEAFCAFSILHKAESFGIFLEHPFWNISPADFSGSLCLLKPWIATSTFFLAVFFPMTLYWNLVAFEITVGYALIAVINGVFLKETFSAAENDDKIMMRHLVQMVVQWWSRFNS